MKLRVLILLLPVILFFCLPWVTSCESPESTTSTNSPISSNSTNSFTTTTTSKTSTIRPTVYYVAKTGSDSNPGTEAEPWLTIQHAADVAQPGDTICIKTGTYNENIEPANSGVNGKYISYQNFGADIVNINASGEHNAVEISGKNYLKFDGLRILGSKGGGFDLQDCNYIIIRNCYFTGTAVGGIYMDGITRCTNIVVDKCEFNKTNTSYNMEIVSIRNVDTFEIKNCIVHDPVAAHRGGIDIGIGCKNGAIYDNEIYGCGGYGIYLDNHGISQSNIAIYNNKAHDNRGGIGLSDEEAYAAATDIVIFNNILYNNYRGFEVDYYSGTETFNFILINNTFYNNGSLSEIFLVPDHTHFSSCIIRNNIFYCKTSNMYAIQYSDYTNGGVIIDHNLFFDTEGYLYDNVFGSNYVLGDPKFISVPENFSLKSDSVAIDNGSSVNAPNQDFTGNIRPQGTDYDIGAYEYMIPASLNIIGNEVTTTN
jgi:hypothetical protein